MGSLSLRKGVIFDMVEPRPEKLEGKTIKMHTGCGVLYVTVNFHDDKPFECFSVMGKAGGCASSQVESIGRMISLNLRSGASYDSIIKQLSGIQCHIPKGEVRSCADAIAKALQIIMKKGGGDEG